MTLRKYQIQLLLGLETELQGHDERVVDTRKHEPLRQCVRDFFSIDYMSFADGLESIYPHGVAFPNLHNLQKSECDYRRVNTATHLAKAAFANDSNQLKFIDRQRLALSTSLVTHNSKLETQNH